MGSNQSTPMDMESMKFHLMEKGRLNFDEAQTLSFVEQSKVPFDEYQELLTDRRNHDSRRNRFYMQVAVTGGVMVFSAAMLATGKPASVYLPVLTGVIGYWMPSPDYAKPRTAKINQNNQN